MNRISATIHREILQIAIPNILGNISIPILGIVDTVLMAYRGEKASILIGAIALGGILFNALYWNFSFLRLATTGITAQAVGAGDHRQQANSLARAALLASGISVLILLLQSPIAKFGFGLLRNPENAEAIQYARSYFSVRIWAVPAALLLFSIRGWFYGMQNAIAPFVFTLILNLGNIGASMYCVRVLGMDADGVALGTVLAQYFTLLIAIVVLGFRYRWIVTEWSRRGIQNLNKLRQFFSVSGFVLGRNLLLFSVFSTFTYYSSSLGETYFAAFQILLQLFFLISFAIDGFAYASEALVGKYTGAAMSKEVLLSIRYTLIWGVGFGLVYATAFQICGLPLLKILTPNNELIALALPYVYWISIIAIVGAIAFIWDGVFIGATLARAMFLCMAISTLVFFMVLFLLRERFPYSAIWAAMTAYMAVRGIIQWYYFRRHWKRHG